MQDTCNQRSPRPVKLLGGPCDGLDGIDETDVDVDSEKICIFQTAVTGQHYYIKTGREDEWQYSHSEPEGDPTC